MSYSRHVFTRDPELSMALDILHGTTGDGFVQSVLDNIRLQLVISAQDILGEKGILGDEGTLLKLGNFDEAQKTLIQLTRENLQGLYEEIRSVPRDIDPTQLSQQTDQVQTSYKSIIKQLLGAKLLKPILALDWSVGRDESADISLGLVKGGIGRLRDILSRKPSSFGKYHLYMDKGPGNGVKLAKLNKKPIPEDGTPFIHVGVGDNLYCNVSEILLQGLKSEYRNNTHVIEAMKVISQIVQIQLRKKWYTENTDYAIGKWEEKPDTQYDLNDIYGILRSLRFDSDKELSKSVLDIEKALLFSSEIFEGDDTQTLPVPVLYVILLVLGMSKFQISQFFSSKIQGLDSDLESIKKEQNKYREGDFSFRKAQLKKLHKNSESFASQLRNFISMSAVKGGIHTFLQSCGLQSIETPKNLFEDSFFYGIFPTRHTPHATLDLNELPIVYFHNFFRGYFTEIPDTLFPSTGERFMLITSVRADSHEDARNFARDSRKNMKKLAQGGVLVIDGVTQSFTGLDRILEVRRSLTVHNNACVGTPGEICDAQILYDPKYEAWYLGSETLKQGDTKEGTDLRSPIRAVMIQKSGEDKKNGLEGKEIEEILNADASIRRVSLEEIENYAGIYIEQRLREIIIGKKHEHIHRLKRKHWAIPLAVKEILRKLGDQNKDGKPMKYNENISEAIMKAGVENEIADFMKEHGPFFNSLEPAVLP